MCALAFFCTAQQRRSVKQTKNQTENIIMLPEVDVFSVHHAFTNKFISPPIAGMNINDTTYLIESSEENLLSYQSGTELVIPKNAFVTKDNEVYNGEVKIFYREFRNPIDIMLSGIPMNNVENADTNLFQSAGMYEVWAYDNKDLLYANYLFSQRRI
jgi:hypothetical protein